MKALSDARIEALAIGVAKALARQPGVEVLDHGRAVQMAAQKLGAALRPGQGLDAAVRARIASLSRRVPEGSREWDLLYKQYSEELARKGR